MQNGIHIDLTWPAVVVIGIIVLFMLGRHPHARPFVFGGLGLAVIVVFLVFMGKSGSMPERPTATVNASSDFVGPARPARLTPGDTDGEVKRWLADKDGNEKSVGTRPDWLDALPQTKGNVYQVVVHTGLAASSTELNELLDQKLTTAGEEYLRSKFGPDGPRMASAFGHPSFVAPGYLLGKKTAIYTERQNRTVGSAPEPVDIVDEWVLLEFGPDVQREIETRWQRLLVTSRLYTAAACCAGVLGLIGLVFGFLKGSELQNPARRRGLHIALAFLVVMILGAAIAFARTL